MDLTITLTKSKGFDKSGKELTESKTYKAPNPSLAIMRSALVLLNGEVKSTQIEDMDKQVDFLVELFGKQFTTEDVWSGLPLESAQKTFYDCVNPLLETMGLKLQQIPPNQKAAK